MDRRCTRSGASATVESLPLLCSSIMAKKLAENPDALVLDVKFGRGAFLPGWDDATSLARAMVRAGERAGVRTCAVMTSMERPLAAARTTGSS